MDDFYSISSMREVSSVLVGQYRPTIAVFCVLHLGSQEQLLLTPKNSGLEKMDGYGKPTTPPNEPPEIRPY